MLGRHPITPLPADKTKCCVYPGFWWGERGKTGKSRHNSGVSMCLVLYAALGYLRAASRHSQTQAGQQKCPCTSILSESSFGPPDKGAVFNISLGKHIMPLDTHENNISQVCSTAWKGCPQAGCPPPPCSVHMFSGWSRSHLHCEDESSAVEWIFPVQGPIQG